MNNRPEILAPAGSMESLRAAVECGADAVYLGAGHFNARRNAKNFSAEELAEAIEYCHVRGVKVHLTLNTLVSDEELPQAMDLIETVCSLGVDALIVQDLGIASLARAAAPDLELHASTQMAVMTPEGFRELAELGFRRAVLPRELSFSEIRAIREATRDTGLELELFIHGALCMSVSGQCYLSAMMGGRSGNRGLCAQPCRLPFSAGETDHALSLRDLSAISMIPELFDAGVTSFKIEGRMKRPEYVAAAVTACRNAADGIEDPDLMEELDAVFSRSGHTDGYLTGRTGHEMFGTRQKEDVTAAAPILKDLASLYQKETRAAPVALSFSASLGAPLTLTASLPGREISVTVDTAGSFTAEAAETAAATDEKILRQLQKTGGTGFSAGADQISINLPKGLYLPVSVVNDLRRNALEALKKELQARSRKAFDRDAGTEFLARKKDSATHTPFPEDATVVRLRTVGQLPEDPERVGSVYWILPLGSKPPEGLTFGVEIPRGLYQSAEKIPDLLRAAKEQGAAFAFAGTLDGVVFAREAGLPILGSVTLNGFNAPAMRVLSERGVSAVTASQELKLTQIERLSGIGASLGMLTYGRQPLMLFRNCPDGLNDTSFDGTALPELIDRKNIRFPVARNGDAYELVNSRPLYLADNQENLPPLDFTLLYMTAESAEEVRDVLIRYEQQSPPEGDFTRGLYYKGVM